jgi:hypothetical protein
VAVGWEGQSRGREARSIATQHQRTVNLLSVWGLGLETERVGEGCTPDKCHEIEPINVDSPPLCRSRIGMANWIAVCKFLTPLSGPTFQRAEAHPALRGDRPIGSEGK